MQPEDQLKAGIRYTVIPRVLVFLTRGDDVLLLRGAPDKKLWANQYNGLGGHIEAGETPHHAALREVYEEAGLAVDTLTLRGIIHVTLPQTPGVMLFVFVGRAPQGVVRSSIEGTPEWISRADLVSLPLVEDLPQLLPRVLSPGPVIFAHYAFTEQGLQITFE